MLLKTHFNNSIDECVDTNIDDVWTLTDLKRQNALLNVYLTQQGLVLAQVCDRAKQRIGWRDFGPVELMRNKWSDHISSSLMCLNHSLKDIFHSDQDPISKKIQATKHVFTKDFVFTYQLTRDNSISTDFPRIVDKQLKLCTEDANSHQEKKSLILEYVNHQLRLLRHWKNDVHYIFGENQGHGPTNLVFKIEFDYIIDAISMAILRIARFNESKRSYNSDQDELNAMADSIKAAFINSFIDRPMTNSVNYLFFI